MKTVFQDEPKGTAHALGVALPHLESEKVLVLNGDTPLIKSDTLLNFVKVFDENSIDMAVLSFYPKREHSYGRIIRNSKGEVEKNC